jgi:hypothetical protein
MGSSHASSPTRHICTQNSLQTICLQFIRPEIVEVKLQASTHVAPKTRFLTPFWDIHTTGLAPTLSSCCNLWHQSTTAIMDGEGILGALDVNQLDKRLVLLLRCAACPVVPVLVRPLTSFIVKRNLGHTHNSSTSFFGDSDHLCLRVRKYLQSDCGSRGNECAGSRRVVAKE